jgi:hypothetical protein
MPVQENGKSAVGYNFHDQGGDGLRPDSRSDFGKLLAPAAR